MPVVRRFTLLIVFCVHLSFYFFLSSDAPGLEQTDSNHLAAHVVGCPHEDNCMVSSSATYCPTHSFERRHYPRTPMSRPIIGVLQTQESNCPPQEALDLHTFVDVVNISEHGALLESNVFLKPETELAFAWFDCADACWMAQYSKVIWCKPHSIPECHVAGIEFLDPLEMEALHPTKPLKALPHELAFLENTALLESLPRQALLSLLDKLERVHVIAGERLICQGTPGDAIYLVFSGELVARVEKDGKLLHAGRLRPGDVIGEMAVFTGDRRMAHVDAEQDCVLFRLRCEDFERIAKKNKGIRSFLTEIMAQRYQCSPHVTHRTVGKYVIRHMIGKGGWGLVYLGAHKTLGMPAAIKMLRHDMAMEPLFLQRFRKEAKTIASLNHPRIVKVFDIEHIFRTVFIVMEYLHGASLRSILDREGPMPPARCVGILGQILDGLGYAHKRGIVHRDVKPDNIFLQTQGAADENASDRIKILDFGLATTSGMGSCGLGGTIHYASPEQVAFDPEDERSDIYSLGIMAYEMVTGHRPYPEEDLHALLDIRCAAEIPDPADTAPDLPQKLREFIITACRIEPDNRFRNAAEAMNCLRPLFLRYSDNGHTPHNLTTLQLFYNDAHHTALQELLESFAAQAEHLGVTVKATTFRDI